MDVVHRLPTRPAGRRPFRRTRPQVHRVLSRQPTYKLYHCSNTYPENGVLPTNFAEEPLILHISEKVNAKVELCRITRQKYTTKERSLHTVSGHFERIFNAVRGYKVIFVYSAEKRYRRLGVLGFLSRDIPVWPLFPTVRFTSRSSRKIPRCHPVYLLCMVLFLALLGCQEPSGKGRSDSVGVTTEAALSISRASALPLSTEAIRANNRGVGLMGRFEYAKALPIFASLMEQYPHWSDITLNLAVATLNRQQDGDEKAALAFADQVLLAEPEHPRAHYIAGLLRLYLSSPAEAIAHFKKVVEQDPGDAYATYYLGQCLAQQSEPEKALVAYRQALALDPYLRSAAYGVFQTLQKLRRRDEARDFIAQYQRLANNPRARLAEFKYTRMGPKAEALALGDSVTGLKIAPPRGPIFTQKALLPIRSLAQETGHRGYRHEKKNSRPLSITVVDLESDGQPELFITGISEMEEGQHNLLLAGTPDGQFVAQEDNRLTGISDINAVLWGDFDNDGRPDAYLCRQGQNQLWRNEGNNTWSDVTDETGTGNGRFDTVDGAFFDADHDGDLDLFLVNGDGPNALLYNNRDGTFRVGAIGTLEKPSDQGTSNRDTVSRAVLPVDFDRDRDADIIILNREPPHQVYINDRLWAYHPASNFQHFQASPALSAAVGDIDADGFPEIYTLTPRGSVVQWSRDEQGEFVPNTLSCEAAEGSQFSCLGESSQGAILPGASWAQMAIFDADGDGVLDLFVASPVGWVVARVLENTTLQPIFTYSATDRPLMGLTPMLRHPMNGFEIVGVSGGKERIAEPIHWPAGSGRYPFVSFTFSGMEDVGKSMRSNASGIGTRVAVRVGARWTVMENFQDHFGPGQNLQPVPVGLGDASNLDFVAIDWSDGVFQTELDLEPGYHHITETQRQLSSCPVLFAWDGEKYAFVTDFLGVGGVGYAVGPGEYAVPRPWENLLLPSKVHPKQGRYVLKLTEPMEEAAYMDAVRLVAYHLPPGWQMVLDERMNIEGPEPTGAAVFYRDEMLPEKAVNDRGEIVTSSVLDADGRAAPPGRLDERFIGRLVREHVLTFTFAKEITHAVNGTDGEDEGLPVLIIDGWVEYPYSQTMFAAWQAGAAWKAPTVETLGSDGKWHTVLSRFGYPAGMPRRMSVPLPALPPGTTTLRLRTNQEIYWDRVAIAFPETLSTLRKYTLPLVTAHLATVGFPERKDSLQRFPRFDYNHRHPFWDTRPMAGFYTEFGAVEELLRETDDAVAIFGAGEELHVEFTAPVDPLPSGWRRYMVLETNGWTKDRDLYTKDGETVAPLPDTGKVSAQRDALHARYNTRYVGW